jgi:dUTP pyrophosphatase
MSALKVQFKKLDPSATIPKRSTNYAAGYDLYALEDGAVSPSEQVIVRTGVAMKMPKLKYDDLKVYASIRDRSGLSAKNRIGVGAGVIDFDYIDKEIMVILRNYHEPTVENNENCFYYKAGDRIAQLILEVHICPEVEEIDCLDEFELIEDNDRMGGFGSTGK